MSRYMSGHQCAVLAGDGDPVAAYNSHDPEFVGTGNANPQRVLAVIRACNVYTPGCPVPPPPQRANEGCAALRGPAREISAMARLLLRRRAMKSAQELLRTTSHHLQTIAFWRFCAAAACLALAGC